MIQTFHEQLLETSRVIADTLGTVFPSFDLGLDSFKTVLESSRIRKLALTPVLKAELYLTQRKFTTAVATPTQLDALKRCVDLAEQVVRTVSKTDARDAQEPAGEGSPGKVARVVFYVLVKVEPPLSTIGLLKKEESIFSAVLATISQDGDRDSVLDMVDRELEIRRLAREGKDDLRRLKEDTSAFAFVKAFPKNQQEMREVILLLADVLDGAASRVSGETQQVLSDIASSDYMQAAEAGSSFRKRLHQSLERCPAYQEACRAAEKRAEKRAEKCDKLILLFFAVIILLPLIGGLLGGLFILCFTPKRCANVDR